MESIVDLVFEEKISDELFLLRQHSSPHSALQQCYEGDTIVIYPGVYSGEGFHELTESITIKGNQFSATFVVDLCLNDA